MLSAAAAAVVAEIQAAFREGHPLKLKEERVAVWGAAIDHLLWTADLEAAAFGVRHLRATRPAAVFARRIGAILDRLPPIDECLPYPKYHNEDVLIARRPGATTVLFWFSGIGHGPGAPVPLVHRWLGRLPLSLVYLRDPSRLFFLGGIKALGTDRDATLSKLRGIVASLGATRIICAGNSGGAYAALHYGLDLSADVVIAVAGPTNLSPAFSAHLRSKDAVLKVDKALPGKAIDLRKRYAAGKNPPRVRIVFGEWNWDDRLHAEYMAGLPTVSLHVVAGFAEHNVMLELLQRDQCQELLELITAPSSA